MGPLISGCAQSMVSRTATLASSERCRISDSTPDLRNDNLHINKTPGNLYALQSLRNMALDHSTIAGAQASAKEGPSYPLCSPAGDLEHLTHKCCQTDTSSYSGCLVIGDSLASFPFFFFCFFSSNTCYHKAQGLGRNRYSRPETKDGKVQLSSELRV